MILIKLDRKFYLVLFIILGMVAFAFAFTIAFARTNEVVCLMVTGKDPCRILFARQAVHNFREQDYGPKRLVIINHGAESVLPAHAHAFDSKSDVVEFRVEKKENALTLGDLRNIARALVPPGTIWTTWDDDDYRAPGYLTTMIREMGSADVLAWTRRTEFNANTGLVWGMELSTGFNALIFARQDMRLLYSRQDTMEDTHLIEAARRLGKEIKIYKNDPDIYVRTVHANNTSLYVDKYKTGVPLGKKNTTYSEFPLDAPKAANTRTFMSSYFKQGLECYLSESKATDSSAPPG
jgi:hypothetical protein